MREITAGELRKILEEHNRYYDTDEEEGEKADLSHANLINASLSGKYLSGANLSGANLRGAHMKYVDLVGADLSNADLSGANLRGALLSASNLSEADLSKVDLSNSNTGCTITHKTELDSANLRNANLSGANLRGAELSYADLSEADLSGANLSGANLNEADLSHVTGLTIEQISVVKTLYGAKLSLERMKQVRKKYPHLLEEIWLKKVTLRSSYKTLSVSEVQTMPNMYIRERYDYGFYGYSKIFKSYSHFSKDEDSMIKGERCLVNYATGLMWHPSGGGYLTYKEAKRWLKELNKRGYAGYKDWRMPTVDEAASLLESSKMNGDLYIAPDFSDKEWWTWTGDKCEDGEGSEAAWGVHFYFGRVNWVNVNDECVSVRPVRSVE